MRYLYLLFTIFTLCCIQGSIYSLDTAVETAYISFVKGDAYARSSTHEEFGFLQTNVPVEHGDELITAENSFLETMFSNGIIIWVNSETFIKVDKDSIEPGVELLKGSVLVRNNSAVNENISSSVETPSATIQSLHNSLVKVDLDEVGEVTVEVWEGNANVYFENGSVFIEECKKAFIGAGGKYFLSTSLERETSLGFMMWSLERDKKNQENISLAYLEENIVGSSHLSDYGEWSYDSNISSYVWIPHVSYSWRPYQHGRWLDHPGGYYWVSYEPWGWAPYHYGRWLRNPYDQWCWVPGYRFAPARVVFISFGRYYGWAPIGYGYHPNYHTYYPGSKYNHTYSFIIGCNAFTFAHKECLHSPHGCNDDSKNNFKPLTEHDIDQDKKIIQVSQPLEPIDKGDTRFTIPDIRENFRGTVIKKIAERFRNNLSGQGIQNIRDREPLRTLFSGRNDIQRFAASKKILNPLKQINKPPKKILKRKALKERNLKDKILAKKKFIGSRKVRRENSTVIRRKKEGNARNRFISAPMKKKRLARTPRSPLGERPIKIVRRNSTRIKLHSHY